MTRRRGQQREPLEAAIEAALRPGQFVKYGAGWDFVSDLEAVAGEVEKLAGSDPARAVRVYETLLAGCYEKAEEVDDSSGNFGMFVDSLYCGWIKARQAAGSDADETARVLLDRMENDPYGFAYHLERDAVKVMDKDGLAAFERAVRGRFEAKDVTEQASERAHRRDPAYARRRWGEVLRAVYTQQGDVRGYVALCEQTELSAQDCLGVAGMLKGRRKPDEALAWVDRGLVLGKKQPHGSSEYDLAAVEEEHRRHVFSERRPHELHDRHEPRAERVVRRGAHPVERAALLVVQVVVGRARHGALVLHAPALADHVLARIRPHVIVHV